MIWLLACISQGAMENENQKAAQEPAKGGHSMIVIAAIAFMAAGVASGGVYFLTRHNLSATTVKAASAPVEDKVVDVFPLDQFVVNLADPDHASFLRLGIELGVSKKMPAAESDKSSPFVPQVRDAILTVITSYQSSQLLAPDGKKKLKEQVLDVLKKKVPDLHVVDVYFTDFIVQQ